MYVFHIALNNIVITFRTNEQHICNQRPELYDALAWDHYLDGILRWCIRLEDIFSST